MAWHRCARSIATMMKMGHISALMFLLLPLCTLADTSVKNNYLSFYDKFTNSNLGVVTDGRCPPQRYFVKREFGNCLRLCSKEKPCDDNRICCADNCHTMCKPPAQVKQGKCPVFEASSSSTEKCTDSCSSDSECPGTLKCCTKKCGKTCTPTLNDIGKPNTVSTANKGFCRQELPATCLIKEDKFCDDASCTDGYKCCPVLCRWECQKTIPEKVGECPASAKCPPASESKSCTSDHDCQPLYKCCASCGNRCVMAVNSKRCNYGRTFKRF
ncbi:hypothetical protein GDO81_021273 [Engystomops pustulosus]|uniref:WAP domain-containing protein n=1 Tax=Engystomops pustulosus TaxID=76066 RepID=A0AAV6ZA14_ENGPU|nr:hypothetical protein GDO81_021273 [Engystomops pustulosus]